MQRSRKLSDLPEPLQPGDAVKLNNPDASIRGMGTAFDLPGISTLFVQRVERNIKLDKSLAETGANPTVLRSLGVERDALAPAFRRESKSYSS